MIISQCNIRFTFSLRLALFTILLAYFVVPLHAQIEVDTLTPRVISSFEGTHFKVAFMQNEIEIDDAKLLRIFMASKKRANVVVVRPNGQVNNYLIQPNTVQTITINNAFEVRVPEIVLPLSVDITSDVPISVYALNSDRLTSDGFSSFPISFWDTSYIVISSPNDAYSFQDSASPATNAFRTAIRSSEFMIIAAEDNTQVTIVPTVNTRGGMIANVQSTITLNNGECFMVQSSSQVVGSGDLSGSVVKSDKPIGVIGGHVRTSVPQFLSTSADSKDHLVEMLPPLNTWGKEYASIPFIVMDQNGPALGGDVFRVVTSEPNTILTIEYDNVQDVVFLQNAGSVYSRTTNRINFPTMWRADKPILVAQFMPSNRIKLSASSNTDPFMLILPPTDKFVSRILFQVPINPPSNENQFVQHFVGITADSLAMENMRYDGTLVKNINSNFRNQKIPKSDYYYTTLAVTAGQHEFFTSRGKFGGSLYGGGVADSYGITLGFSLGEQVKTDSVRPRFELRDSCGILFGSTFDLPYRNASGIDDYYQLIDSSINVTTSFNPVSEDSVQVLATVTNRRLDAQLVLDVYDSDGNGTRLRYFYVAPKFELPTTFEYGNVSIKDTTCRSFYIYNRGVLPMTIGSIDELVGAKLNVSSSVSFPFTIKPKDSLLVNACITPNNEVTPISDSIVVDFGCGIMEKVGINANLELINIFSQGWDFGPVRIGDTVCAEGIIVNISEVPILITELPCGVCDEFILSTVTLPINLQPNDTLKLPVCFAPDSVRSYFQEHTVVNEFNVDSKYRFTGRGIKPEVVVNSINWLEKRVGTTNDSAIVFKNLGEANAVITYLQEVEPRTGSIILPTTYSQSFTIPGFDSVIVPVTFLPQDTFNYSKEIRYSVDWKFHDTLTTSLMGLGILPYIKTIDIDFGVIPLLTTKDSLATVVFSFGNENLTIDQFDFSVVIPANPFTFLDPTWQNGRVVPRGDSVQFLIRFAPTSVGAFEERVNVLHDANPNYVKSITQFVLRGVSAPLDTFDATTRIIAPNQLYSCTNDTIYCEFINTSNTECVLESIDLTVENATATHDNLFVAKTLAINERFLFPVQLKDIFLNRPVSIKTVGNFRNVDTTEFFNRADSLEIPIISDIVTIEEVPKYISVPGDTILMEFSGRFSDKLQYHPERISVSIEVDYQVFKMNNNFVVIQLTKNGITSEILVPAVQTQEKISFEFPQDSDIFSGAIWKIQIPTLILLSDMQKEYPISITFAGNSCSEMTNQVSVFAYDEICVRDLRNVGVNTTRTVIAIVKPNPVGNTLIFDAQIAENTDYSVYLTNTIGEIILLNSKINLKKGLYSLKFDVTNIANGTYVVHLVSDKGDRFTYPVIINK
jgi:CUB/sushi domain-containing protein